MLGLIPHSLPLSEKLNPKDFTRERKLPLRKLIVFILHLVGAGRSEGVDIESGRFFKDARRSGLWDGAKAIHRSALTKARQKVPWTAFRNILIHAVALAYEIMPERPEHTWRGMKVLAIDGSNFTLPATQAMRDELDPRSGLQHPKKGHYPQCLVSTLYDVFRRLPVARTIQPCHTSERGEVEELLSQAPENSLVLFDRGYPSFELLLYLMREFSGRFLMRCPGSSTFAAIMQFVEEGKDEGIVTIHPPKLFSEKVGARQARAIGTLTVRAVRMVNPDGEISVLLTDLGEAICTAQDVVDLYFRRWEVEVYYREEKVVLDVEKFHGRTSNAIRQELFAAMIMTVISRILASIAIDSEESPNAAECQMKNATLTLAAEAAVLTPDDPEQAIKIFEEILHEIARVKYYRPKKPRPPQPRVSKGNVNQWKMSKAKKLACAKKP